MVQVTNLKKQNDIKKTQKIHKMRLVILLKMPKLKSYLIFLDSFLLWNILE